MKPHKLGKGMGPLPGPRSAPAMGRSSKQPSSWGVRTAPRAMGDSSLNPENNFELGWGWGSRSKLLSESLTGPSSPQRRKPPPWGTVRAPGVSQRSAGEEQRDQRGGESLTTVWGWGTKGTICSQRRRAGLGSTASRLGSLGRISFVPSPAPFCPLPWQSLRPGWVLRLALCVGGGALSVAYGELGRGAGYTGL